MASFSKYTQLQKQIWPEFRDQSKNLKQKEEIYGVIQKHSKYPLSPIGEMG